MDVKDQLVNKNKQGSGNRIEIKDSVIYKSNINIEGLSKDEAEEIFQQLLDKHLEAQKQQEQEQSEPTPEDDLKRIHEQNHEIALGGQHVYSPYGTTYENEGQYYFQPNYGQEGYPHLMHQEKKSLGKSLLKTLLGIGL